MERIRYEISWEEEVFVSMDRTLVDFELTLQVKLSGAKNKPYPYFCLEFTESDAPDVTRHHHVPILADQLARILEHFKSPQNNVPFEWPVTGGSPLSVSSVRSLLPTKFGASSSNSEPVVVSWQEVLLTQPETVRASKSLREGDAPALASSLLLAVRSELLALQLPPDDDRRPGDWDCPSCGALCFAWKNRCFKCGDSKPGSEAPSARPSFHRRPEDWNCPSCGVLVFGSKDTCFKCSTARPVGAGGKPGDWNCLQCGGLVFASRESCFKCHAPRPAAVASQPDFVARAERRRPGDWDCPKCNASVFASKDVCFKCNYNRAGGDRPAPRQGGGGGRGKPGDWNCSSCGFLVFASKSSCPKCHTAK